MVSTSSMKFLTELNLTLRSSQYWCWEEGALDKTSHCHSCTFHLDKWKANTDTERKAVPRLDKISHCHSCTFYYKQKESRWKGNLRLIFFEWKHLKLLYGFQWLHQSIPHRYTCINDQYIAFVCLFNYKTKHIRNQAMPSKCIEY